MGHHHLGAAVVEQVRDVVGRESRVHHHHHRAELERAEQGADERRSVRERDQHAVLGLGAGLGQQMPEAIGEGGDVAIGEVAGVGANRDARSRPSRSRASRNQSAMFSRSGGAKLMVGSATIMDAVRTAGNLEDGARRTAPAFGHALRAQWALDPAVLYLNHGTVGAPPRRVLEAQQRIRDEIERQPATFLLRELSAVATGDRPLPRPRLRVAADQVAEFLGARGDDLVFVDNVTSGINAVLRSFPWKAGDEVLITDLGYGAIGNAARHITHGHGALVQEIAMPDLATPAAVVEAFVRAIGPHTRLAVVDHVASESAWLFPVAEIAAACRARGVAVVVDGAHAPGAIPLAIPTSASTGTPPTSTSGRTRRGAAESCGRRPSARPDCIRR